MKKKTINILLAIVAILNFINAVWLLYNAFYALSNGTVAASNFTSSFFRLVCTAICVLILIQTNRKDIEEVLNRRAIQKQEASQARAEERKASRIAELEKELEDLKKDGK